jgi:hypothetical protein
MKMDEHTDGSLRLWREATASHDIKFAAGRLQARGSVDPQHDLAAQRAVSKDRGDDAGHLLARQFGGREAPYNLSIQNYRQNQGGGTYWIWNSDGRRRYGTCCRAYEEDERTARGPSGETSGTAVRAG